MIEKERFVLITFLKETKKGMNHQDTKDTKKKKTRIRFSWFLWCLGGSLLALQTIEKHKWLFDQDPRELPFHGYGSRPLRAKKYA